MPDAIPLSGAEQIYARISALQVALTQNSPGYESILHEIHVALHKDEEVVTLLTEEQVGVICAGLSKKKNIIIAETEKKNKSSGTATGKKLRDVEVGTDL